MEPELEQMNKWACCMRSESELQPINVISPMFKSALSGCRAERPDTIWDATEALLFNWLSPLLVLSATYAKQEAAEQLSTEPTRLFPSQMIL